MDLTLSRLIGTLKNTFRIGKVTFDASSLGSARTLIVPDKAGTLALTSDLPESLANGAITSQTYTSSFIGVQMIDTFAYSQFGSAKYIIYCTYLAHRQICELLLLQDGVTVSSVEYANIVTSELLGVFTVDIELDYIRLLVDAPHANINYKMIRTSINK